MERKFDLRSISMDQQLTSKMSNADRSNDKSLQQNTFAILQTMKLINNDHSKNNVEPIYINPEYKCASNSESLTKNVYVNPNFKPPLSIHINPKIHAKALVHINPKMMHNIANSNKNSQSNTNINATAINIAVRNTQENIKRSVYVNPTLMKKLVSSVKEKSTHCKDANLIEQPNCSRLMPAKTINNHKVSPKKTNNSNIVLLSQRKLVRMSPTTKHISESTRSQYKLQKSVELIKKDLMPQKNIEVETSNNNELKLRSMKHNTSKPCVNKSKITNYKITKNMLQTRKIKKTDILQTRKIINNKTEFVTIGGIVYKSSKNRLIRRSYSSKRNSGKQSINSNNDQFIITTNGKKLQRLKTNKEILNRTLKMQTATKIRCISNISSKTVLKNNISNKVKQKSIQILRNKTRKNNQPCLIFQRFGYCANQKNGKCPRQHDKRQVFLCKKFLQGKCVLDKCPLSHDIGPEKMPTCKYFLDGCCTRDACPYLHVKMSSNTSICIEFLQGYCIKGNECQRRHEYLCPQFDKLQKCSRGKYCPYPHKSHSSNVKENTKYLSKTCNVQTHQTTYVESDIDVSNTENRLRYYERVGNVPKDFVQKEENIMEKGEIILISNVTQSDSSIGQNQINETNESLVKESANESQTATDSHMKKRAPIGFLPAYIPIN